MERIFEQTLLYDFYGELLTAHQQEVYEDAIYNDMSLSEIAEEHGISRQGVHDLIKRCDKILQDYETKLHLVEKFMGAKEKISEIERLTQLDVADSEDRQLLPKTVAGESNREEPELAVTERMQRIRELSQELMKEW